MKAIALVPGTTNLSLTEREDPQLTAPDDVKLKVLQVGICGTDREEAVGGRAEAPQGSSDLVLGHEMFGQVAEVGSAVKSVKQGDFAMFTVRRGCGRCNACRNNRSDMCYTGLYTERGIKGADGFQSEYVVDKEQYLVKIPEDIKDIGVLTEPMSVAVKAIDEAIIVQLARLRGFEKSDNWLKGKKALIAGIGPIGLMAAFSLQLKGAIVVGMDIVDENTLRPQILKEIGGIYVDGRKIQVTDFGEVCGEADFIFEATGIARLQIELIDALAVNGVYVATGIPGGERPLNIPAGYILQQLVLKNQIIIGSVNASPNHYRMAVEDLKASAERWPHAIRSVVTEKVPYAKFEEAFRQPSANEIKVVIDWT